MGTFRPPLVLDVLGREFTLVETSAPAGYDYNGLTIMGDKQPDKGESRFVLVPSDILTGQLQRYASGMYTATIAELGNPFSVTAIRDELWKALVLSLGSV